MKPGSRDADRLLLVRRACAGSAAGGGLELLLHLLYVLGGGLLLVGIEHAVAVGVEILEQLLLHLRIHRAGLSARAARTWPAGASRPTSASRPHASALAAGTSHLLYVLHGSLLLVGVELPVAVGVELLQELLLHLRAHHAHPLSAAGAAGSHRAARTHCTAWPAPCSRPSARAWPAGTLAAGGLDLLLHLLQILRGGLLLVGIELAVAVGIELLEQLR
jgi:hypothetical protein